MRILLAWPDTGTLARLLASWGHHVTMEASASASPPELALLDASLPGAPAGCRELIATGVAVLALLPGPDRELAAAFLDAGADVVVAPVDPLTLEARVRSAEALLAARLERHKAEESASLALERFRVLTEAAFEGIAVHAEGRILYCNRAFATLLGAVPEALVGAPVLDFAVPEDRPRILANISSGFDQPYRARALRPDGGTFPVEIRGRTLTQAGRVVRISAFRDLTAEAAVEQERRRAEEALARSEARFRQLIEEAPDAVAVVGRDGKFLFANRKALDLTEARLPEDLLGRSPAEYLTEASRALFAERTRALFEGRAKPMPSEYDFRVGSGPVRPVEVISLPIEFEGRPALLAFVRDVAERRRIEAQLRRSERMASLGLLAAGVAHEINNPLSYVVANLEFATARAAAIPEIVRALEDAREGAARVAKIVRDLRVYTRAEDEPPVPVDVREPLRFALAVTEAEVRHRARVVLDLADVPPVLASEGRLGQVFVDLLTNAAHSIDEGAVAANVIRVATRVSGDRVEIEIEDSGRGIPEAHLPRLFEPFFTTKPPGQGTGLGLFVSHGIVRSLGGEIRVESEAGKGTCVRVSLPIAPASAPRLPAAAPEPARTRGGRRVLVIDDEPDLGTAIARLLEPEHLVTVECEAESALERLRKGEEFDVILCDLMMPRMTGMDLYAELVRTCPEQAARMIFLTGGAFTPRSREFLEEAGRPQVEKPFALEDLLRTMELVGKKRPN
ncbi:MAG: PAS domain S-box protein [Planctomycetes bacterium]|nr:PAS domain S-box protein [Planctomycetota bacterium]